MPFTNNEFPGQVFENFREFEEARSKRINIEAVIEERSKVMEEVEVTKVTAVVIPAPPKLMEKKIVDLESKVDALIDMLQNNNITPSNKNNEGLPNGTILRGESKGTEHTIEVLPGEEGYLCSNGEIYQSLSGAALGVSGNRRSGWKFWKNIEGTPIGEVTGRFARNAGDNPFDPQGMRTMRI